MRRVRADGITIYPVERLGNQLFIYAAGLAQARRLGVPCYANLAFYRYTRPRRSYSRRTYELEQFDSGVIVPPESEFHRPLILREPSFPMAAFWHREIGARFPLTGPPVFMERSFRYDERIDSITPGTTLFGYFQSWKYFREIAGELRERMFALSEPSDWYRATSERIVPGSGAIALNVRRGDYTLAYQQERQGLATRDYYARALEHLRRLGLDGPVYVASDSLSDVLEEFAGLGELVPIDPPAGVNPFEVLLLLSRADGLVAANSTFSWWAGFLGERPGRVVIAPRPWFTLSDVDTRDLLPPDWITLDRETLGAAEH
jgi:hypothetical protein